MNNNRLKKINGIQKCPNLREVYLSGNGINSVYGLCSLGSLTILDLSYNAIRNYEDIAMLSIMKNLLVLKLAGN